MFSKKSVVGTAWLTYILLLVFGVSLVLFLLPGYISGASPIVHLILSAVANLCFLFVIILPVPIELLVIFLIVELFANIYRKFQFGLRPKKKAHYLSAQTRFRATKDQAEQLNNELGEFAWDIDLMTLQYPGKRADLSQIQAKKRAKRLLVDVQVVQADYNKLKPTLKEDRKYPSLKWYNSRNIELARIVTTQQECVKMRENLLAHCPYHEEC